MLTLEQIDKLCAQFYEYLETSFEPQCFVFSQLNHPPMSLLVFEGNVEVGLGIPDRLKGIPPINLSVPTLKPPYPHRFTECDFSVARLEIADEFFFRLLNGNRPAFVRPYQAGVSLRDDFKDWHEDPKMSLDDWVRTQLLYRLLTDRKGADYHFLGFCVTEFQQWVIKAEYLRLKFPHLSSCDIYLRVGDDGAMVYQTGNPGIILGGALVPLPRPNKDFPELLRDMIESYVRDTEDH